MNPIVSMNSSTAIPLSTVTFLKACSDINCLADAACPDADPRFSSHTATTATAPRTNGTDPNFMVVSRSWILDLILVQPEMECGRSSFSEYSANCGGSSCG